MEDFIKILAETLSLRGKVIEFSQNSIFAALALNNNVENFNSISMMVANNVRNDISNIRNKMLPLANTYVSKVEEIIATTPNKSALLEYKVTERRIPELLEYLKDNGHLPNKVDMISLPINTLSIPVPKDDIREYFKFDNTTLNTFLKDVLVKYDTDGLIKVWEKYLGNVSGSNNAIEAIAVGSFITLDEVLLMTACVSYIKTNRPDGVTCEESTYINIMDLLYLKLTTSLLNTIEKYDVSSSLDKLVISYSEKELIVNGDILDKFLETNTVDTLLGLLLSGEAEEYMAIEKIIINSDKYLRIWEDAVKRDRIRMSTQEIPKYRTAYEIALDVVLKDVQADTAEYVVYTGAMVDILRRYLAQKHDGVLDIYKTSMDVFGLFVFTNTNFSLFVNTMIRYAENNKSLSPEEVATLSTIDMVLDYLMQQFVISDM